MGLKALLTFQALPSNTPRPFWLSIHPYMQLRLTVEHEKLPSRTPLSITLNLREFYSQRQVQVPSPNTYSDPPRLSMRMPLLSANGTSELSSCHFMVSISITSTPETPTLKILFPSTIMDKLGPPHLHWEGAVAMPSPVKYSTSRHYPSSEVNPPMKKIFSPKGTVWWLLLPFPSLDSIMRVPSLQSKICTTSDFLSSESMPPLTTTIESGNKATELSGYEHTPLSEHCLRVPCRSSLGWKCENMSDPEGRWNKYGIRSAPSTSSSGYLSEFWEFVSGLLMAAICKGTSEMASSLIASSQSSTRITFLVRLACPYTSLLPQLPTFIWMECSNPLMNVSQSAAISIRIASLRDRYLSSIPLQQF